MSRVTPPLNFVALAQQARILLEGGLLDIEIGLQIASAAAAGLPRSAPERPELVLSLAAGLRRRFDWEQHREDLVEAMAMLEWEILWVRRRPLESRMRSERVLAGAAMVMLDDPNLDGASHGATAMRAGILQQLAAEVAIARAMTDGDAVAAALVAHAHGLVAALLGSTSEAIASLRAAHIAAPDRVDVARDLCRALLQSGDTDLRIEGTNLLGGLAARWTVTHTRDAFNAYRVLAWIAGALSDWRSAAEAYEQAARASETVRATASDDFQQQRWQRMAFAIYADAAIAYVRAGEPAAAAAVIERNLARELGERLGARMPDSGPDSDEAVVYVVVAAAAAVALIMVGDRVEPVSLDLDREQVNATVLEYLTRYAPHRANPDSNRDRREWMNR